MMVRYTKFVTVLRRVLMQLTVLNENDDGSVDVRVDNLEPELHQLILQTGLLKLLKDALDKAQADNAIPALFKKPADV
jgi:hypothetical protein